MNRPTTDRILRTAAIVGPLLLMILIAWTPGISFTEDLGRHLVLGKIISEQHMVPDTNYLTYTHPDFPFVNHHWLSEVFLYQLHRVVGLNGLIVWKMIMLTSALGLAMAAVRPAKASSAFWVSGILAAVMISFRSHIRPELFTYLFIAAYLYLFEQLREGKRWPRWAIPVIALLWANLHIYFIFGIGMVFLFAFERWQLERTGKTAMREAGWFGSALLVSCINPNGLKGFFYPFTIFTNYGISITENASPLELWQSVLNPMLLALPVLTLLFLIAALLTGRRHMLGGKHQPLRLANILIAGTAVLATWTMARSASLLALTALPIVAAAITNSTSLSSSRLRRANTFQRGKFLFLVPLFLNLWLCVTVLEGSFVRVWPSPIGPTPLGFDQEERYLRLRELKDKYGLKGPVFSDYNLGSLIEYELYPEPGYVDNRPEAFPAGFWRTEYLPALGLGSVWANVRERRNINTIIVSLPGVKEDYCRELMRRELWVLIHLDEFCAVWVKNSYRNKDIVDALHFNRNRLNAYDRDLSERIARLDELPWWQRQIEADALIYRIYGLICIDQIPLVWPHLWKLYQRYPDYQIIHELMRVSVPPSEIPIVEGIMERHAHWPVSSKQVLDWGHYLISQKRWDKAELVFRRGQYFFPLSSALRDGLRTVENLRYQQNNLGPTR